MHRIHSIDVWETECGSPALIIVLGGELTDDFEPIIRLETDKTLRRERSGGIIVDLTSATSISNSVIGRIIYFARFLATEGISTLLVIDEGSAVAEAIQSFHGYFEAVFHSLADAKEKLGIEE